MNGPGSYYYFDRYVNTMKTPEKIGISSFFVPTNAYVNNNKLVINIKYTNEAFWEVLQYQFIEGKPYTQQQIESGEFVAVISEDTRNEYFGTGSAAVGKYIETDNVKYRVTGVVKAVPVTMIASYADIFVPYTVSKTDYRLRSLSGNYMAVLLGKSKSDLSKIKAEYDGIVSRVKPDQDGFDLFESKADRYLESFIRSSPLGSGSDSGLSKFIMIILVFILIFMLLPTLNLVNINVSRIMERSSEIGVRKAFGASSGTLVGQFITENLILTFFGAVIGVILAFIILQLINHLDLIANIHLTINGKVLFYSFLACLFFGLLSGVYPAWRMSRLQVVQALKTQ